MRDGGSREMRIGMKGSQARSSSLIIYLIMFISQCEKHINFKWSYDRRSMEIVGVMNCFW